MNDITINFTLTHLEVLAVFTGLLLLLSLIISINNHWAKLKPLLLHKEAAYWLAATIFGPLFVMGLIQIFGIVFQPKDIIKTDIRGYAVLLAAIISAPFVIWRTLVAQRSANTEEQGLITDRITKAVEQLGAEKVVWKDSKQSSQPNLEVRLGGIHALGRVAEDSRRDQSMIVNILSEYVQNNASINNQRYIESNNAPRCDINAVLATLAMTVFTSSTTGETTRPNISQRFNIKFSHLRHAHFHRYDFSAASLFGSDLTNALLVDTNMSNSDLRNTTLNGVTFINCDLSGTDSNNAICNNKTDFYNSNVTLMAVKGMDLSGMLKLTQMQVSQMFGDNSTLLPPHVTRPSTWPSHNLSGASFYITWYAAKKEAGLP